MRLKKNLYLFSIGVSLVSSCLMPANAAFAQTGVADLKPAHAAVLKKWLAANSGWRLALEKDYGKDNLNFLRQGEGDSARPFYVAEDFNRDKKEDFAVVLVKGKTFAAAVFNAPFSNSKPAFFTAKIESGDIVYFNRSTKLLLVGPYASDAGFMLKPTGKTYKAAYFETD